MAETFHVAVSVDIDRFADRELRRRWLTVFRRSGLAETPEGIREVCRSMRASGMVVFPSSDCDNRNADGMCAGHREEVARG